MVCYFFQGSGRIADIIAFAYSRSGEEKVEVVDNNGMKVTECVILQDVKSQYMPSCSVYVYCVFAAVRAVSVVSEDITSEVRRRLKKEFGEKDIEKRVNMAIECVKRRAYITVFRQDGTMSGKNIDESILKALLKGSFI